MLFYEAALTAICEKIAVCFNRLDSDKLRGYLNGREALRMTFARRRKEHSQNTRLHGSIPIFDKKEVKEFFLRLEAYFRGNAISSENQKYCLMVQGLRDLEALEKFLKEAVDFRVLSTDRQRTPLKFYELQVGHRRVG
ncbi:hypothetical protein Ciccas_007279 [Cichlidogyrus casuarinus]|uniref:Uncharacterized protein n=1 Tax=Cichlidogyrus casuarinus TaxID=1844966 RepID=A0ABD2Q3A7_9PLAT